EDLYNTAKERDLAVKLGTHEKPKNEAIPSKRGEIYKNIALILVDQGKVEEAKKAISDARKANPEDMSLALAEANLYLETKDFEMYKKIIAEILEKNPNDANLVFNLGVISANAKNAADAEKYYKRVMEIDPNYVNAYINLAALKLEDEKVIIEEMNKLGNSEKDMKRYAVLKSKRENLFKSTIPYLEKAHQIDPANLDVAKTLLNVYSALEMPEYKPLKVKVKEMEAAAAAKK
ncbi:MAG TPA: tetratricopeptide repeat protein, partial [Flavobacterium sp.]